VQLSLTDHEPVAGLRLIYCLQGPIAQLRIPPPVATPGAADGLWQQTCFEWFVAEPDQAAYQEFNFSPSGDWAAYRFERERVRNPAAEATAPAACPRITVAHTAQALQLQVWLPLSALPPLNPRGWQLGLSAVLQDHDGRLSYWALHHPKPQPDFHHRSGWTQHLLAG
jgi:hypothetical protein